MALKSRRTSEAKSCGAISVELCGAKNSPGMRSDAPNTISAGDNCKSSLNVMRRHSMTAGRARSQGVSGVHFRPASSVAWASLMFFTDTTVALETVSTREKASTTTC